MKGHKNASFIHAIVLSLLGIFAVIFAAIPIQVIFREIKIFLILTIFLVSILYGHLLLIKISTLCVSLLTCFAGGIILGVCLLDLLYDTKKHFNKLEDLTGYPFVELFIGIGLLSMLLIDDLVTRVFDKTPNSHKNSTSDRVSDLYHVNSSNDSTYGPGPGQIAIMSRPSRISVDSTQSIITNLSELDYEKNSDRNNRRKYCMPKERIHLLLVGIVFAIFSFFEGFSFGSEDDAINMVSLFFGIMAHKSIIMFNTGVDLAHKYPQSPIKRSVIIVLMSSVTPIGSIIGYILVDAQFNQNDKVIITGILQCISISVFLYVSLFEILAEEKETKHSNFVQWLAYSTGFVLIALLVIVNAIEDVDQKRLHMNTTHIE